LRLRLHWDEELVQVIDGIKNVEIDWRYINLYEEENNREDSVSTISSPEWEQIEAFQELKIKQIQEEDRKERYKLEEGNLFRVYIIKQNEDLYTCILSSHHAILDGWSNPILFDYVHQTYQKLTQGKILDPTWFAEDSVYLNAQKYLQDHQKNNDEWWRNYLSKIEGLSSTDLLSLTTKLNEKNDASFNLKDAINSHKRVEEPCSETLVIKDDLYQKLKRLSKNDGITLNVLLQYAWHKALKVYGSNNIDSSSSPATVVGTVVSGRNLPIDDIDTSVGLYINTLPLVVEHGKGTYLLDDIRKLQNDLTEINTRSNVNLPNLHKNGTRLFDTVFIFENYPIPTRRENAESSARNINNTCIEEEVNIEFKKAIEKLDYPIAVFAYETTQPQGLTFSIKYAGEMFHNEVIEQLLHFTKALLSQVAEGLTNEATKDNFKIEDLTYLTQKEKELILTQWNNTEVSHPRNKTIHQLFEEQV
ncbi:MAG: hypothetical protein JNJ47_07205, partial [Alphaproteobacteria bacterium]|nr:hypothetical protein [Alphaproteobacteria bacterium]